ncbi:thiosulfate/3-mercaptopyruvate sulfurtransferase [Angomonas deanei]|nr:thiosulfate/3-mercaptopyruvate sulfurtransferase [Angomonas deanei]|eukprot:EPY43874.1 thiosulfate/3-mercaptopyruvate sulfurtransferase [Angomonas deanei]
MSEKTVFVSVNEIRNKLESFLIFDARYSLTDKNHLQLAFPKGHLPSAQLALMDQDLAAPPCNGARHPLPPADKFIQWCMEHGVDGRRPVLCYDDTCGGLGACRLWWMLQSLGVEAYVLDGGYQAYQHAGLPLEEGPEKRAAPVVEWRLERDFRHHVRIHQIPPNAVLVDARAAPRYQYGVRSLFGGDPLPGHIEGALNLPFMCNIVTQDGVPRIRGKEEAQQNILAAVGDHVRNPQDLSQCVFQCGSGVTACFNIAMATHVGLGTPFLYCGSWSEYATVHRVPLTRQIVEREGLFIQLLSPCLCATQPKAQPDNSFYSCRWKGSTAAAAREGAEGDLVPALGRKGSSVLQGRSNHDG